MLENADAHVLPKQSVIERVSISFVREKYGKRSLAF